MTPTPSVSFRDKLAHARRELKGWERTPVRALAGIGRSLGAAEIRDALAFLDELADERARVEQDPAANADESDEIHFAQQEVATALRHVPAPHVAALLEGLDSSRAPTRFWTADALKFAAGRASLPRMEQALAAETDELARRMLAEAIASVQSLPPGLLGSLVRRLRRRGDPA